MTNAEIAKQLLVLAQLLSTQPKNLYKVKAYRRAARTIEAIGESLEELVRADVDLQQFPNIGSAISSAIQEIVRTGSLRQIEKLRSEVKPELAAISEHPRLDPRRVLRIYKRLGISSVEEMKAKLESGELALKLGPRMEQHVRRALAEGTEMMWYDAARLVSQIERFLIERCGVRRAEPAGSYRRKAELVDELSFVIETGDFASVISKLEHYGGKAEVLEKKEDAALLKLSSGTLLKVRAATKQHWGLALIEETGSEEHVRLLKGRTPAANEASVYRKLGLSFIPPELREGHGEIELASAGRLPSLVTTEDIRGELHAHTTASDGANSIEEMVEAARERGLEYIGISDHSQSLKIAGGLSEEELWEQIRVIDEINERLEGFRILKSTEVDILQDGSLDYPDDLLKELDYTVCSIHSRFGMGKAEQTERILRAMDNRYFNILGHATGRLLLKRPGYEIDIDRVIEHARKNGCYFELNSSPDRLDVSADHARLAREAGVKIAITTDAHSTGELDYVGIGVDQARRAGFDKQFVLNHASAPELLKMLKRP